jgi:hypothetical protein
MARSRKKKCHDDSTLMTGKGRGYVVSQHLSGLTEEN